MIIPKPVWAVGFALEQTLRDATLAVFSFLILKRLQHSEFKLILFKNNSDKLQNRFLEMFLCNLRFGFY
ncbi:MAG: hypothetical protein LBH59_02520 [Planctomycetaceae bacterium]|nr:hypothetical protein [Planctomycetaceae bacterium]